jgi:hypothetical protein
MPRRGRKATELYSGGAEVKGACLGGRYRETGTGFSKNPVRVRGVGEPPSPPRTYMGVGCRTYTRPHRNKLHLHRLT